MARWLAAEVARDRSDGRVQGLGTGHGSGHGLRGMQGCSMVPGSSVDTCGSAAAANLRIACNPLMIGTYAASSWPDSIEN